MQWDNFFFGPVRLGEHVLADFQQWLDQLDEPFSTVHVLVDSNTLTHCLPELMSQVPALAQCEVLEVDPGEETKSMAIVEQCWMSLLETGADRQSLLISLGGGVVTDLGGMLASTFMRGIAHVSIPTSLLGMVDAGIGGKHGVNVFGVKNLAGCFLESVYVAIWPGFLSTLPDEQFRAGFAEVVKHAILSGGELWEAVQGLTHLRDSGSMIDMAAQVKIQAVTADPFENSDSRKALNLGHGLAHAIETVSKGQVSHGDAVASGLWMEVAMAENLALIDPDDVAAIHAVLDRHWPRCTFTEGLWEALQSDKKRSKSKVMLSLSVGIGKGIAMTEVQAKDVHSVIAHHVAS
ncbi:MAG: 3-dehydroquinate synthase [Schleiferiaceae bacterium]|nr:3-dehydroquinate synthase [Schleiferiaceae bacterium]